MTKTQSPSGLGWNPYVSPLYSCVSRYQKKVDSYKFTFIVVALCGIPWLASAIRLGYYIYQIKPIPLTLAQNFFLSLVTFGLTLSIRSTIGAGRRYFGLRRRLREKGKI